MDGIAKARPLGTFPEYIHHLVCSKVFTRYWYHFITPHVILKELSELNHLLLC
jgi:hypothetical protein